MINNKKVILGLDISVTCIGVTVLMDDDSEYGKIIELTHISPKISSKIEGMEQLFLKKNIFEKFINKYKDFGIDEVVIEEPLLSSNNVNTCATLLRFNGMISDSIYNILGVVPIYISSYDARKYSFPSLMAVRKYNKEGQQYDYRHILNRIVNCNLVLFGSYSWEVDKKIVIQDKVSEIFPDIQWLYNSKGELLKQNFDAADSYVVCLAHMNRQRYGELEFKVSNIKTPELDSRNPLKITYTISYWNKKEDRTTYIDNISNKMKNE